MQRERAQPELTPLVVRQSLIATLILLLGSVVGIVAFGGFALYLAMFAPGGASQYMLAWVLCIAVVCFYWWILWGMLYERPWRLVIGNDVVTVQSLLGRVRSMDAISIERVVVGRNAGGYVRRIDVVPRTPRTTGFSFRFPVFERDLERIAARLGSLIGARAMSVVACPPPWQPVTDPSMRRELLAELHKELPAGHVLAGVSLEAVARRPDRDDVLFEFRDASGRVAVVHLTHAGNRESDAAFPTTRMFAAWTHVEWDAV